MGFTLFIPLYPPLDGPWWGLIMLNFWIDYIKKAPKYMEAFLFEKRLCHVFVTGYV